MRIGGYKMDNRPDPHRPAPGAEQVPMDWTGWQLLVALIVLLIVIVAVFA